MRFSWRYLVSLIIIIGIEVLIALFASGNFVRNYVGDILVVIVIYCFVCTFLRPNCLMPATIFVFATLIEIGQYFSLVSLLGLENNKFFSIVLGTVFDLNDILCYFIGCCCIAIWQWFSQHFLHTNNP